MNGASPLTLIQRVLRRIPFARLDVNCLHCLEYYPREDDSRDEDKGILTREGVPIDIEGMAECRNFPESLPERFATHEHCIIGIREGKVIGYQWFCDKPFRIEERYGYVVEIPSDALYGYDAFVLSNYRRSGVWTCFHAQFLQGLLTRLGRSRIIVMVDQNNSVSMKAHQRLGYRLYRKVYIFVIFGKCFWIKKAVDRPEKRFAQVLPPRSSGADPKQITSLVS